MVIRKAHLIQFNNIYNSFLVFRFVAFVIVVAEPKY
jgi:hypothetical protein